MTPTTGHPGESRCTCASFPLDCPDHGEFSPYGRHGGGRGVLAALAAAALTAGTGIVIAAVRVAEHLS